VPRRALVVTAWSLAMAGLALWFVLKALGLLDGITNPRCHQDHPFCISDGQQVDRGIFAGLCFLAAAGGLATIWPVARWRRPDLTWYLLGGSIAVYAIFVLVANPVTHLQDEFSGWSIG
jgi:hypothetical protein